jgi:hypothetical protein
MEEITEAPGLREGGNFGEVAGTKGSFWEGAEGALVVADPDAHDRLEEGELGAILALVPGAPGVASAGLVDSLAGGLTEANEEAQSVKFGRARADVQEIDAGAAGQLAGGAGSVEQPGFIDAFLPIAQTGFYGFPGGVADFLGCHRA